MSPQDAAVVSIERVFSNAQQHVVIGLDVIERVWPLFEVYAHMRKWRSDSAIHPTTFLLSESDMPGVAQVMGHLRLFVCCLFVMPIVLWFSLCTETTEAAELFWNSNQSELAFSAA